MQFEVKGVSAAGRVRLLVEAADRAEAVEQARRQGLTVVGLRPGGGLGAWWAKRQSRFRIDLFSRELLALLNSGLNLIEALQALREKEQRVEARSLLEQILQHLYQGESFSTAIAHHPHAFPTLYVASVRASERTGNLPEALARYIAYAEEVEKVRKKAMAASIYPLLLLVVGGLVTLFLLAYVVPRFSAIYESNVERLPWASRLLMEWGHLLQGHALEVGGGLLLILMVLGYGLMQPAVHAWVLHRIWRIPTLGERLRVFQLTRFYRTVGMLLSGGIPAVTALGMAEGLLQPELRVRLQQAAVQIREGKPMSHALEANGLTTPVALRMLRVGEKSGRMGEMMEAIAAFYDEETGRWVDWFTRLFEPLLMAGIGLVIGLVVVLLYLPIFELVGSLE